MPYLERKLKHYNKGLLSDMSAANWAGLIVSVIAIVSGFAGAVQWLVKHYLNELKPNSGSSMRDEQTRQGATIAKLELRVDEIYRLLVEKA
jgi:hypothetical protein